MKIVYADSLKEDMGLAVNIFTLNQEEQNCFKNYWLAKEKINSTFIMNLGCQQTFEGIQLVNTHNYVHRNRATKRFR